MQLKSPNNNDSVSHGGDDAADDDDDGNDSAFVEEQRTDDSDVIVLREALVDARVDLNRTRQEADKHRAELERLRTQFYALQQASMKLEDTVAVLQKQLRRVTAMASRELNSI